MVPGDVLSTLPVSTYLILRQLDNLGNITIIVIIITIIIIPNFQMNKLRGSGLQNVPKFTRYVAGSRFKPRQSTWNILLDRPHLGPQISEFKNTEIISRVFSDHNAMRLEINYRIKTVRNTKT